MLSTRARFLGGAKNNGPKYASMLERWAAERGVRRARYVGRGHALPLHSGNLDGEVRPPAC